MSEPLPDDPRIAAIHERLSAHGIEPGSSLESGLRAARDAEASCPGCWDASLELALELAEAGIDPERVLYYGVDAVVAARGESSEPIADWLAPVGAFARALHEGEVPVWDAVTYGVRNLARICGPELSVFAAELERFGALLITLQAQGASYHRLTSYGIGALSELVEGRLWALPLAYRVAERVGASGGDPGWIVQGCVCDWTRALLHEEGVGPEVFERVFEQLGGFLERAPEAGMSAGSRLADGLATFARYGPDMHGYVEEWLELVLALIRSMCAHEISPYLPIGNGLGGVVGHIGPEEVAPVLRFAVSLADRGIHPGGILYEAFMPLAGALGADRAIEIGRRLADQGYDPFFLMRDAASQVAYAARRWPEAQREGALDACLELLCLTAERLHAHDHGGRKVFGDAVPYQAREAGEDPEGLLLALRIGAQIAEAGLRPGMTIAYGWPRVQTDSGEHPWLVAEGLAVVDALVVAGVDPEPTLSYAFPVLLKVSEGQAEIFAALRETLLEVVTTLAAAGIDSRDVLYRDVSAMAEVRGGEGSQAFGRLLDRLREVLGAMQQGGVSPAAFLERGLPAAAKAGREQPWRLDAALARIGVMGAAGHDGTPLLEHAVGTIAEIDGEQPEVFEALLSAVAAGEERLPGEATSWCLAPLCEAAAQVSGGEPEAFARLLTATLDQLPLEASEGAEQTKAVVEALPLLAGLAGNDAEGFGALVETSLRQAERLTAAGRYLGDLLWYGLRAIGRVAEGRPAEAGRCLAAIGGVLCAQPPEVNALLMRPDTRGARHRRPAPGIEALARVADDDADGFVEALPALCEAAGVFVDSEGAAAAFGQLVDVAAAIPPATLASFASELRWLTERLGDPALRSVASRIAAALGNCSALIASYERAWPGLIRPALLAHGPRAAGVLASLRWIGERAIRQDSDLEILTEIVTQTGVRAMEIMDGLIVHGIHDGVIKDLTADRDVLSRYIREVPLADPQIYAAYREIQRDAALSEAQRREAVAALQQDLETLCEAVRAGDVSAEQARAPLFALVLYYLFPPAMSSSRDRYLELYRRFDDHPEHLAARDPGELRRYGYALRQGAWELLPGAELDRSPWELVTEVAGAPPVAPDAELATLGWALLGRWAEGRIGRHTTQRELLARVLARARQGGIDVPPHADTPAQLLAGKEFLGDHVRDVVEQALIASRADDEARYDRMVRDKLAPDTEIGPGLVKSMWQLAQALAAGQLPADVARKRLEGQLRGFVIEADRLAEALAACRDRDSVRALLQRLPIERVEIEHGKEQSRLLADFVGQQLTAMQRELFGAPGHPAKLAYRISDDAPAFELTCELTKRNAHAPIGICQGVCVATDIQLWDNPSFFQVIFWGPDGIAAGGMHVLLVRDGDDEVLTLPGINPSMRLLNMVEPSAVLDTALDYAWRLARRWGCAGVWVPTRPVIHSNRRHIHQEIAGRGWPTRTTVNHPFSTSPYTYSFSEVFEVPEPEDGALGGGQR